MRLEAMLPACLLIGLIGWHAARRPGDRVILGLVGALAVVLAIQRGYYWNLFGRGHGFFTANRATALVVFAGLLLGPSILRRHHGPTASGSRPR
jgi:hypothetical protein